MNRAAVFFSLCVASAVAASNWSAPLVGVTRDAQGTLHPVHGVSGSFVVRGAIAGKTLDWAFAASGGLLRTADELLVLDAHGTVIGRRTTSASEIILNPRYAFFPETGELWPAAGNDHGIRIQSHAIAGQVIALGPADQRGIVLAACRADRLWLLTFEFTGGALQRESAIDGSIGQQACRAAQPSALLVLEDRLLLATAREIVIQTFAGLERRVTMPPNHGAEIHRAGENAAQIELSGASSVLARITAEGERLYELPAAEARQ